MGGSAASRRPGPMFSERARRTSEEYFPLSFLFFSLSCFAEPPLSRTFFPALRNDSDSQLSGSFLHTWPLFLRTLTIRFLVICSLPLPSAFQSFNLTSLFLMQVFVRSTSSQLIFLDFLNYLFLVFLTNLSQNPSRLVRTRPFLYRILFSLISFSKTGKSRKWGRFSKLRPQ